jgi:putative phosphoesterase
MRIALIADIHGNLAALEAVLAEIARAGVDEVVCLGDVAATGPQPREVLSRVRELGCPVVMGNADAELFEPGPPPEPGTDQAQFAEIDRWAAAQLGAEEVSFVRSFQPTISIPLEQGGELLCVHGSPRSFNDVITATTPEAELSPMLGDRPPAIVAGGHTHFPMLRRYGETLLINPGSVGLAYAQQGDGRFIVPAVAEYATLTVANSRREVSFHQVAYDQGATVRVMHARAMPHAAWWAADWQWSLDQA